jgi:hypothetical protein
LGWRSSAETDMRMSGGHEGHFSRKAISHQMLLWKTALKYKEAYSTIILTVCETHGAFGECKTYVLSRDEVQISKVVEICYASFSGLACNMYPSKSQNAAYGNAIINLLNTFYSLKSRKYF